jgi:hypothetical protein
MTLNGPLLIPNSNAKETMMSGYYQHPECPKPVRRGVKMYGDSGSYDGGYEWAVFPAGTSNEDATAGFPDPHYGGPGQGYCKKVCVRRSRTRVLVTQRFGLDI